MGLFDEAIRVLKSQVAGAEGQSNLLDNVLGLINNPATGGISDLVQRFSDSGLSKEIASWISTGENLPVSGQQIQAALGTSAVQDVATKLGIAPEDASKGLANLLPQVIDQLTPHGSLPEGHLLEQGLSFLKGKLS
jgi:uncharacterized protein YidB (DUF937 family)